MVENEDVLISPEQVAQYRSSELAREAVGLFSRYGSRFCTDDPRMTEFCLMRDHLFFEFCISNAHRSGVLANVTVQQFKKGKWDDEGNLIMMVLKHKTSASHGPAVLLANKEIAGMLTTFIKKVRKNIIAGIDNIFTSWTGVKMQSGAISYQLNKLWEKAGIFKDSDHKNISCTVFRKSATTGKRLGDDNDDQIVADHMAHNIATANKHYHIRNRQKGAAKASTYIKNFYEGQSKEVKNLSESEAEIIAPTESEISDGEESDNCEDGMSNG